MQEIENENDSYADLMGGYIHEMASAEKPPTLEREVIKNVAFESITFEYRGRAMELPQVHFKGLNEDDKGEFVVVEWGYPGRHHSMSQPVIFKDRRIAVVEAVKKNKQLIENNENLRQRTLLKQELQEIQEEIEALQVLAENNETIEQAVAEEIHTSQIIADLKNQELDADDQLLLEALTQRDKAQLALMAPNILQRQLQHLNSAKETVESILRSLTNNSLDVKPNESNTENVLSLFSNKPGQLREIQVKNTVLNKPTIELEIIDNEDDNDQETSGSVRFIAQGSHIPKPFPLAYIALEQLMILTQLDAKALWHEETIGSVTEKQGGVYRYIRFSSRTGRHSGWAYVAAMPLINEESV